jgi:dihydroorotase
MPNLRPPVTTARAAIEYRERIPRRAARWAAVRAADDAVPHRQHAADEEIHPVPGPGRVHAVKLYPAGATTNSDAGVTDLRSLS